jgi:hypothetical protein
MMRVAAWVAVVVGVLVLAWLALHVFISPVHPDQQSPAGHPSSACWACHFVTDSADLNEL